MRSVPLSLLLILLLPVSAVSAAQPTENPFPNAHAIQAHGPDTAFTFYYPDGWNVDARSARNATFLRRAEEGTRISISTETRSSHKAALDRLAQLAGRSQGTEVSTELTEISGWPAVERVWIESMKRRGLSETKKPLPLRQWLFSSTAIAVGRYVVRFEAEIPSQELRRVDLVKAIARSVRAANAGDPAATRSEIEQIRGKSLTRRPSRSEGSSDGAQLPAPDLEQLLAVEQTPSPGLVLNTQNFSEIEVAASGNGQHVIVATNLDRYSTSHDAGASFGAPATLGSAYSHNGDPTVGWGQSGDFYFAIIAYPDNDPDDGPGDDVDGCTNAVMGSTDDGDTFSHRGHAAWCQRSDPTCFPDQEHIAVDRWNPSATNEDQLYNTWRNFTPSEGTPDCDDIGGGFIDVYLTCSVDSGVTWNNDGPAAIVSSADTDIAPQGQTPVVVSTSGDFARVAVGQDGFVYVVYIDGGDIELAKYTSCAAGLDLVDDFPTTVVAGLSGTACPIPGLDRCSGSLSSWMVAIDDLDASHVFVGYAENTSETNENVYVIDSLNGGLDWEDPVRVNSGFSARRFMPWTCSVCGEAFVGFYDRRSSNVIDNSLTDYYLGRAKRSGGSLVAGTELRVSPTADSQCGPPNDPDLWCTPRSADDSESCSQQPQLAGACVDHTNLTDGNPTPQDIRCDFSDCGGAGVDIDFTTYTECTCTDTADADIRCDTGGGCPKYGDYSGIACEAGRVYAAWASATPPGGPQDPDGDIDTYSFVKLFGCEPQIQVPGDVSFVAGSCDSGGGEATLNVCNTGKADLVVDSIASDDDQFAVTTPSSGYPIVISPDFCFPFEVTFVPDEVAVGTQTATLTIFSNDPVSSQTEVTAEAPASIGTPNIVTTFAPGGSFGDVCLGSTSTETLTIQNSGGCDLVVTSISVTTNATEFKLGAIASPPITIAAGDSVAVPVRFEPTGDVGAAAGQITIVSNDPDNGGNHLVALSGNSPPATLDLFVADSGAFGNVCVDDYKDLNVTVQNNGVCPLELTGLSLPTNDDLFVLPSGNAANAQLEPNNSLLLPVRFAPTSFAAPIARDGLLQADGRTLFATSTLQQSRALSGVAPPPDINVPADTGADPEIDFGNVCAGVSSDINIPVCNTGLCTLEVTDAYLEATADEGEGTCLDFTIVQNPFPDVVSHDFCMDIVVRYTPDVTSGEGTHTCVLHIESDDPDEGDIYIDIEGTTPTTTIDIPGDMLFPPEVVQQVDNCSTLQPFPIGNNGLCPIEILDMDITSGATEYGIDGLPSMPTFLPAGHVFGAGDLDIEFAPNEPIGYWREGVVSVDYISDSVSGANTVVPVDLCGDAFYTGARVLVTNNGGPVGTVERIQIQRITANRNRRPRLDTVSVYRDVPLTHLNYEGSNDACQDIEFHTEYGTPWNTNQLLPGVYQINATIRVNGRRYTKSVGFSLNSCDFNPQVIVSFNIP